MQFIQSLDKSAIWTVWIQSKNELGQELYFRGLGSAHIEMHQPKLDLRLGNCVEQPNPNRADSSNLMYTSNHILAL